MTAKKKITDKNGVQVYPITHTKAVLDDNGNSVEQRLQENLDLINQKQLEVGAVPSDIAPTEGSTNWVTSGGVHSAIQGVHAELTELSGDVDELTVEVDDNQRIIADLKEVTGLTESSYNMFGRAIPTHLIPANGKFALFTTAQSYIIPVEPNKTVTVDGKTSGNRFQIFSSETMPEVGVSYVKSTGSSTATKLSLTLGSNDKYILLYVDTAGNADVSNIRVYYGTDFNSTPSTILASKAEISLFDSTEKNEYVAKFFKSIKVYGVPHTTRILIRDVWKNHNATNSYRIYVYTVDTQLEAYIILTTPQSYISVDLALGGHIEMVVDWDSIPNGYWGTSTNNNIISLKCYENYYATQVEEIQTEVEEIQTEVENIPPLVDKIYIKKSDLTEIGYYDESGTFVTNSNIRSLKIEKPLWAKIFVYSNTYFYNGPQASIKFYDGSEVIISTKIYDGVQVLNIPQTCTHISISYLVGVGNGEFSAYISVDTNSDNTFTDTEASLRDALWALDNKNPFVWKNFDRANVTFMQDGCKDDVNSFRLACEKYGVPFTTSFQTARLNASITFSDVDGNAKYFGRELIAGQEYVKPIESGDAFTKLRVYCDCRCLLLGQQANITIKYYTSASEYTTASENVTLSAGKTYVALASMSNVIKVGIIVSCGSALTLPLVNFCLTPYDETANNTTKTGAEIGKLIHQNYGEVMQHGDWLFNTLDKDLAYNEFIKQSYVYKKGMEDAIGVKIQGIIGLGGPNSDRWQHTEMGQKFMLRQYLYSNWFGTTPQYSIPRSGAYVISGQVFTFTSSASLSVNSQYLIDVGSNKKDTIIILSKNGTSYIAAKRTNNNAFNVEASGNLYNVGSSTSIGTFTNGALADDATIGYWYVEQNKENIATAISNNSWLIIWCHSEIKASCFEYMVAYISGLASYGTGIKFATFADMYDEYKSSTLLGA